MHFGKRECLQQKINHKDSGQTEWVIGMFFILILSVVLYTQLRIASFQVTGMYLEDALAASDLASALIDVEAYGKTRKVWIPDAQASYQIYREAVRENLGLDEAWVCTDSTLIDGQVEIADYVIYNVDGNLVTMQRLDASGNICEQYTAARRSMRAPNGLPIEKTGIYSEIRFPVRGPFGITFWAHKGKLVDIAVEEGD